ncbi:MAG TPA: tetratricopeptide repeat protein [Burkholderiaceae bacterium]
MAEQQRALLLTDIVDSTGITERLGETAASALWAAHDRAARDLLRQWHGREIDKSDGFLLLFEQVADAAGFALAYHRVIATLEEPLRARAGIHVGPLIERHSTPLDIERGAKPIEVDGIAKPIAGRLMMLALPRQTLLSADAATALGIGRFQLCHHGPWRVRGVETPIDVFEVGDETAPFVPPRDTDKAYRVVLQGDLWVPLREMRHTLPAERDRFVGRAADLRSLQQRRREGSRLISLLGIGGTGKTRLAQRFGWTWLGDFPGGVWFCDLTQARGLEGLVHAVAQGLDVPLGGGDPVGQLGDAIAGRGECLVILDNFEQLVAHAEATLGRWLDRANQARFLVTTREVLGIVGEVLLTLAPLDASEAASLFIQRAEAVQSGSAAGAEHAEAIARLVKLLDGLPLAIELAAARVRVFTPALLVVRMSERFRLLTSRGGRVDRQATLRATLDWSWELLSEAERATLGQLSVFRGGFTLEAIAATVDTSPTDDTMDAVDITQSLVDKSLIWRSAPARFDMLASVQEYAAAQLAAPGRFAGSGPDGLRAAEQRHGRYFGFSPDVDDGPEPVTGELDNFVAACERAIVRSDAAIAVATLERGWKALALRGPFDTGYALAIRARALEGLDAGQRIAIERVAGQSRLQTRQQAEARAHFEAGLSICQDHGLRSSEGWLLHSLAELDMYAGDMTAAAAGFEAALALARELGDRPLECTAMNGRGTYHQHLGQMAAARRDYSAALVIARSLGARRLESGCLGNLGQVYANLGELESAGRFYDEAIVLMRERGDRQWEGNTLCNLGLLYQTQGRIAEALACLVEALQIAQQLGYVRLESVVLCNIGLLHEAGRDWSAAETAYRGALDIARRLADKRSQGQFLNYLGACCGRQSRFDEARECLDRGTELLTEVSDRISLTLIQCSRAEVESLAGNEAACRQALAAAHRVAETITVAPDSELGIALARATAAASAVRACTATD